MKSRDQGNRKSPVTLYTTPSCPYCVAAKRLLNSRGVSFEEIDVSEDKAFDDLVRRTGWKTVPQIFIGDRMIGGFQELEALDRSGKLEATLGVVRPAP